MSRGINHKPDLYCLDCLKMNENTPGSLVVDLHARVEKPGRIAQSQYGELAGFEKVVLCPRHLRKRRQDFKQELVPLEDAVKFVNNKNETRVELVTPDSDRGIGIQSRLAKRYLIKT